MPQISKPCLTAICGTCALVCIGSAWVCQFVYQDSIALAIVGRNLGYVGGALAAATFTYTGVHCINWWNTRDRHRRNLLEDPEIVYHADEERFFNNQHMGPM
jgi:hypothetical protein